MCMTFSLLFFLCTPIDKTIQNFFYKINFSFLCTPCDIQMKKYFCKIKFSYLCSPHWHSSVFHVFLLDFWCVSGFWRQMPFCTLLSINLNLAPVTPVSGRNNSESTTCLEWSTFNCFILSFRVVYIKIYQWFQLFVLHAEVHAWGSHISNWTGSSIIRQSCNFVCTLV